MLRYAGSNVSIAHRHQELYANNHCHMGVSDKTCTRCTCFRCWFSTFGLLWRYVEDTIVHHLLFCSKCTPPRIQEILSINCCRGSVSMTFHDFFPHDAVEFILWRIIQMRSAINSASAATLIWAAACLVVEMHCAKIYREAQSPGPNWTRVCSTWQPVCALDRRRCELYAGFSIIAAWCLV